MKVRIKSFYKYDFVDGGALGDPPFDDCLEEVLDAIVTEGESQIKIEHKDGCILIEENKLLQKRNCNEMEIRSGEVTSCVYTTEHGDIELEFEGVSVERFVDGELICRAVYFICPSGAPKYVVRIEIEKM